MQNLEQLWRFCFPTAVVFNPKTDQIIVADSQRNRLQMYKKVRDYADFQANLNLGLRRHCDGRYRLERGLLSGTIWRLRAIRPLRL